MCRPHYSFRSSLCTIFSTSCLSKSNMETRIWSLPDSIPSFNSRCQIMYSSIPFVAEQFSTTLRDCFPSLQCQPIPTSRSDLPDFRPTTRTRWFWTCQQYDILPAYQVCRHIVSLSYNPPLKRECQDLEWRAFRVRLEESHPVRSVSLEGTSFDLLRGFWSAFEAFAAEHPYYRPVYHRDLPAAGAPLVFPVVVPSLS